MTKRYPKKSVPPPKEILILLPYLIKGVATKFFENFGGALVFFSQKPLENFHLGEFLGSKYIVATPLPLILIQWLGNLLLDLHFNTFQTLSSEK